MANQEKQTPRKKRGEGGAPVSGGGPSIWIQLTAAFAIFIVLSSGYSFIRQYIGDKTEEVPLSQIAVDITSGTIDSISVAGNKITAIYLDKSEKTSRKEGESSLVQTLRITVSRPKSWRR